jgi:uncharacterized RDD family membrane protein YckC
MANLNVKTSFNTILNLNSDAVAKRILAYFIDFGVMLLYVYLVIKLLATFNLEVGDMFADDADRIYWGYSSILTLPLLFYTLISEVVSGGYTIGKYLTKLKVVKIDGFQPTFVDFFTRWIFRIVDIYPFVIFGLIFGNFLAQFFTIYTWGLMAVISIVRSKLGQRLGDRVAGTSVIRAKQQQSINITILEELEEAYKPVYAQVINLSDNDARIIKETYQNAKRLGDKQLIDKLVLKLESVMKIKSDKKPNDFIEIVLKDFNYYTQNM